MMHHDDGRLGRDRIDELADGLDRLPVEQEVGGASQLVQTVDAGSYPTGTVEAGVYYACDVLSLAGDEAEGAVGSTSVAAARIYCRNVGGKVPPAGTVLVAVSVADRWAICYNG